MIKEINKLKILIALIIFFQGFNIGLLSHPLIKASSWFRILGWLMMICSAGYIYFLYRSRKAEQSQPESKQQITDEKVKSIGKSEIKNLMHKRMDKSPKTETAPQRTQEDNLITKFMNSFLKKAQRFSKYTLVIIGALIIDAVIIYNIVLNKYINPTGWDMITILFGVSLILYYHIPNQFSFARDFFVFFLGLLFLILIFPPIFYDLFLGSGGSAQITRVLLADPVSGILNAGGIDSYTEIISEGGGQVAYIYFPLKENGLIAGVGIAEACSGIYTASIFLAAFITFILIEYKKLDFKVGVIIGLGIFTFQFEV